MYSKKWYGECLSEVLLSRLPVQAKTQHILSFAWLIAVTENNFRVCREGLIDLDVDLPMGDGVADFRIRKTAVFHFCFGIGRLHLEFQVVLGRFGLLAAKVYVGSHGLFDGRCGFTDKRIAKGLLLHQVRDRVVENLCGDTRAIGRRGERWWQDRSVVKASGLDPRNGRDIQAARKVVCGVAKTEPLERRWRFFFCAVKSGADGLQDILC